MQTLFFSPRAQVLTKAYLQAYRRANLNKLPGDFEAISQLSVAAIELVNEVLAGNAAQTGLDALLNEILAYRDLMAQAAPQPGQPLHPH